ncbi:MAG: polysaccharide deacetylase [Lachnospiraceae bacterium]|nr:polysaccharide deacetylase [Lachnospiraceae bacterium]
MIKTEVDDNMDESNYEDILKRRQQRRQEERNRRRRKVMFLYILIFAGIFAAAVLLFGFFKGRNASGPGGQGERVVSWGSDSQAEREELPGTSSKGGADSQTGGTDKTGDGNETGDHNQNKNGSQTSLWSRILTWPKQLFTRKDKGLSFEQNPGVLSDQPGNSGGDSGNGTGGAGQSGADTGSVNSNGTDAEGNHPNGADADGGNTGADLNTSEGRLADLLYRADRMAAGYDYDGAIALLQGNDEFSSHEDVTAAVSSYEAAKATLVEQDISQIPHVFFHSIIMDTAKAFDGDSDSKGYNQVMTTKSELDKILNEMYRRGYVLVRLHDMAQEVTDENGNVRMTKGKILLPPGKKAFVMSQDDVCYYPYMEGDGFASRIVIGEDGMPTCEMVLDDGSTAVGNYDLVPILEAFIQEHPDFSYKGARAVLAFTGYEGILGYRTAASYKDSNPDYEADRQKAAQVAQRLRECGWELASHSWGHRYLGQIDLDSFKTDTNKWESEVESLIGPTDIILYPFGDDISDWHPYSMDNERYAYLHEMGFRYFCNVDASQTWVQLGDDYLRQGRLNLDGYRMWQDIAAAQEGGSGKRRLDGLFRAEDVFDPARPTPVEWN